MKIFDKIKDETRKVNKDVYNFSFSSNDMEYESLLIGFNKHLYKLFDNHYEKVNVSESIKDLFNGKKVNDSENQAAHHHLYRDLYLNESKNSVSNEQQKLLRDNID